MKLSITFLSKRVMYGIVLLYLWLRKSIKSDYETIKLGSSYSEWDFYGSDSLKNCNMLSCGAGEDISFEVEFASIYNAKIYFVDPTERAIAHISNSIDRCGMTSKVPYSEIGSQNVLAYDLRCIDKSQFIIFPFAVYDQEGEAKFYAPKNSNHVSFSLNGKMMGTEKNTYALVETKKISTLVNLAGVNFTILKMDIEGVAFKVLTDVLRSNIYFDQILVEFEELKNLNVNRLVKFIKIEKMLKNAGYSLIKIRSRWNFTYLRVN